MSRELKFRAWVNSHWADWLPTIETHGTYNDVVIDPEDYISDEKCYIEQATGLYDKNCKEIYEGDIVDVAGKKIGEVVYDINQLRWVLVGRDWWVPITALSPVEYEILGNIHENQDIMDEQPPAEVENEKD